MPCHPIMRIYTYPDRRQVAIAPGASLTGANLSRADLSRADLTGADLTGANLSYAALLDANLTGASLTGANLSRANLSRANLSRADLFRADLACANLTGAGLLNAGLAYAYLTGVDLTCAEGIFHAGTRSDGFDFYVVRHDAGIRIEAGCRWFTWRRAIDHWSQEQHPYRIEMAGMLGHIRDVTMSHNWPL